MIFERRLTFHLDWALLAAILALSGMGLVMIYSTTWDLARSQPGAEFWRQMQALVLGLILMAACMSIDYRSLTQRSLLIYGALIVMLVAVFFFGVVRGGSRRWIPLGLFNLQPSEFGGLARELFESDALANAMCHASHRSSPQAIAARRAKEAVL